METRWLYVTSENFGALRDASKKTCVIPVGCVEKHGLHLPLGSDIIEASSIAYEASKIETVCVFPDFTFGDINIGIHRKKPDGTLSIGVELQTELLEALCDQIAENGFEKIIVLNGHGGNRPWLSAFSRNLGMKPHKFVFADVFVPAGVPKEMGKMLVEQGRGVIPELTKEDEDYIIKCYIEDIKTGHGCLFETALMLGISPEAVHLERLGIESGAKQASEHLEKLSEAGVNLASKGWEFNYPNWYQGDDPVGCNERIGKAVLRISSEKVANAYKAFKDDEEIVPKAKASWKNDGWE